ncbi:MAG: Lrp/AsnC family transcriptional regulator [Candidatus Bathyarchaeia archaeon]
MKFDSVDLAIVNILRKDARRSFTSIARELGISPTSVHSRFSKMKKAGLIRGSVIHMNLYQSGGYVAQMGIRTVASEAKNVAEYLYGLKLRNAVVYCWECMGHYNVFAWIYLKDILSVYTIKRMITQNPAVIEVNASIITELASHYDKFDVGNKLKG